MDADFWTSRVDSIKHFSHVQSSRHYHSDIHLGLNESDGDENARACFPCPFCYVDIEIQVLCCHLQDEHCFNLKDAGYPFRYINLPDRAGEVCPLCAASLGKDVTGHFIAQHASSLKRRRKPNKTSSNGRTNIPEPVADPLLLPFLSRVPDSDSKGCQEDNSLKESAEVSSDDEADREERRQKAAFVQELTASTIFI